MRHPDEAIERIPKHLISLPTHGVRPFLASQLAKANYKAASRGTDEKTQGAKDRNFYTNNSIWEAIIYERIRRTDVNVVLDGFFLFEWLPHSPGLFYTPRGKNARQEAERNIESISDDVIVYNPYGKASMLDGGVGNVRLKPIEVGLNSFCLMSASSSGISHEGFPVALPIGLYNDCIEEIARRGAVVRKLVGNLRFIPETLTALYSGYTDVPQLYLEVQEVLPTSHAQSRHMQELRVSVAVGFISDYEGSRRVYAAYVNFDPSARDSFRENVSWMERDYVNGKYKGQVITDFDQQKSNFANAPFSLEKVMSLGLRGAEVRRIAGDLDIDAELILQHQSQVVISIGELYTGSKYQVVGGHVEALGDNAQVRNVNHVTDDATNAKPPDSLGQAFLHLLWPIKPLWRNLFLLVAGVIVLGFLVWSSLPDATKSNVLSSFFNKKPVATKLTPAQIADRDFFISMGDDSSISNPKQALVYYQKALDIDPQNEEVGKKVDSLRQQLIRGGAR